MSMLRSTLPARRTLAAGGCAAAMLLATCACSSAAGKSADAAAASASPSPRGSASAGSIQITDAYLPQPASADVAAVYFTVTDTGDEPDRLLSATSVPSAQASLMSESSSGNAESMSMVSGGLPISAHGKLVLAAGGYHVMLTDPVVPLKQGGTVLLTLTFQHAGKVSLDVPITSLLSDAQTGATPEETAMAGMPGM